MVRAQDFRLSASMRERLPREHLADFIADTVDSLDLQAFHDRYATDGPRKQPFHLPLMVKVLMSGHAIGVFSSRKFAAKLRDDVARRTTSNFTAFHLSWRAELAKVPAGAKDSTKAKASVSCDKSMSDDSMRLLLLCLRTPLFSCLSVLLSVPFYRWGRSTPALLLMIIECSLRMNRR